MIERGQGGSIVNISSACTTVALKNQTSYCASKGAVDTLTKVMALELGAHQVSIHLTLTYDFLVHVRIYWINRC